LLVGADVQVELELDDAGVGDEPLERVDVRVAPLPDRLGDDPVTVGASVSILNCRGRGIVLIPSVAVHCHGESLFVRKVLTLGQVVSVAP